MTGEKRSSEQIRASLRRTRRQLDDELNQVQQRVEDSVKPAHLLSRYPLLTAAAGVAVGIVVIRNPATVARVLSRFVQTSAPLLIRGLLQKGGAAAAHLASPSETDPET